MIAGMCGKISKLLLVISMILILPAGCSQFNNTADDYAIEQETPQNTDNTDDGKYYVAFSQCNFAEPWRTVMNNQMKKAAEKYPELNLVMMDGRQDNNKQISDIEFFINDGCDLLMVSPNEAKPLTGVIEKAYDMGIPVILIDRKIEGESYTQYIGTDNYLIGKKAGEWVSSYLGKKGGNVVEIMGALGTSAQQERHEGFIEGIEGNPNIRIIDQGVSDWLFDRAIAVMEGMLERNDRIDVVFAHNDPAAEGAYKAAKNAGRVDEMKFVGIDGLPTINGGIKGVMDGRIDVTYLYPNGAEQAIDSAYKYLVKGEILKKEIKIDTMEITGENAEEIYNKLNIANGDGTN